MCDHSRWSAPSLCQEPFGRRWTSGIDAPGVGGPPYRTMEGHSGRRTTPAPSRAEFATVPLDRRRFLILLGGVAAYAALRPHAAWARRLAGSAPILQPWTLSEVLPGGALEQARALIGASVLAPSFWNARWRHEKRLS